MKILDLLIEWQEMEEYARQFGVRLWVNQDGISMSPLDSKDEKEQVFLSHSLTGANAALLGMRDRPKWFKVPKNAKGGNVAS